MADAPFDTLELIHPDLRHLAIPIDQLNEDPENANDHDDASLASIAWSFQKFGQRKPIVVRREGMIAEAGNGTLAALRAAGWTHLACVVCDDDKTTAMAYGIADNQSARMSKWDFPQLAVNVDTLLREDYDLTGLGWSADELADILAGKAGKLDPGPPPELTEENEPPIPTPPLEDESDENDVPEPPPEPITKPGDVIELGPHVLHCADCMDVLRSLPDNSVDAIVTDPPYGLSPDGRARTWDDLDELRSLRNQCQDRCPTHVIGLPSVFDANDAESEAGEKQISIRVYVSHRAVQVGRVKLDNGRQGWKVEIADNRPVGHVEDLLVSEWNAALREAIVQGQLALRVREGLAGCVGSCACATECSHPFGGVVVGLAHDALGEPEGPARVVTLRRAKLRAVLAFDVAGNTAYLFPARGADEFNPTLLLGRSHPVRARPTATGLPPVLESAGVGEVGDATHRTLAFDLRTRATWIHRNTHDPSVTRRGFMNKTWDAGVPGQKWAAECLRVLKPGGHLIAFSATRTYHRLACAVEDAGFEIRDLVGWVYYSGMPKSHNVSKAIDDLHGVEREVVGTASNWGDPSKSTPNAPNGTWDITVPATDDAKRWDGWGTGLKPAIEPHVLARKPIEPGLTVAHNVLKWGTGGINIDACRMADGDKAWPGPHNGRQEWKGPQGWREQYVGGQDPSLDHWESHPKGLWPGNIYACPKPANRERNEGTNELPEPSGTVRDVGGAAHTKNVALAKNHHPTVKPVRLMRWLLRLVTPPGGTVVEPFGGSGTTLVAAAGLDCRVIAAEMAPEYCDIIRARVEYALAKKKAPG